MDPNSEDTKSVGPLTLRLPFDLLEPHNFKGFDYDYDFKDAQSR